LTVKVNLISFSLTPLFSRQKCKLSSAFFSYILSGLSNDFTLYRWCVGLPSKSKQDSQNKHGYDIFIIRNNNVTQSNIKQSHSRFTLRTYVYIAHQDLKSCFWNAWPAYSETESETTLQSYSLYLFWIIKVHYFSWENLDKLNLI